MVSFQCDGCQDVVKKPKLDSHGARCHASFTCIDCSKTFAGPAQWKGHTSCMSEEQKYHKSVYQEPRGRGGGRGQRGGRGRGSGRPSYAGSGENAIPLGPQTNAWTAPPPDPVNNEPFNSNEWTTNGDKAPAESGAQSSEAATSSKEEAPEPEKKSKKSKKRKAEEIEAAQSTPVAAPAAEEPAKKKKKKQINEPITDSITNGLVQPEGKEKQKKSRKSEVGNDDAPTARNGTLGLDTTIPNVETAPQEKVAKKDKKDKKSKKSRKSEVPEEVGSSSAVDDPSTTWSNGEVPTTVPLATFVNNNSRPPTTMRAEPPSGKQSKSEKVTKEPQASNGVEAINGRKSDKKEKSSKKDRKDKKEKKGKKAKQPNGVDSSVGEEALSESPTSKEPQSESNDLVPISTIEVKVKGGKEKKAKKEKKVKDNLDLLPITEPVLEQAATPVAESKKSKKRKDKDEPVVCGDPAPSSGAVSNVVAENKEKPKKKSKRRDKEVEAVAT